MVLYSCCVWVNNKIYQDNNDCHNSYLNDEGNDDNDDDSRNERLVLLRRLVIFAVQKIEKSFIHPDQTNNLYIYGQPQNLMKVKSAQKQNSIDLFEYGFEFE